MGILPDNDNDNDIDTENQVVEGPRVAALTDDEWHRIFERPTGTVFARTTPQNKLHIVEKCRALGAVVAVTGDGVNDAPAMRAADIGAWMAVLSG